MTPPPRPCSRLAEITRPAIADDEILVQVGAASVDRDAWHLMAALAYPMRPAGFGLRRPKAPNPGRSLAGTVESAGPTVTEFKPGDEVYGTCDGSFAPYARAQAGRLAPKPVNLSFAQAATVPVSALTALQAVQDQARVQPGQKVLIVGASGGPGTFAVQIAKAFGAQVTGVCGTAKTDLPDRLRRVDLGAELTAAGFEAVEVPDRPGWRTSELAMWQEAAALDPGDDPALRSFHDEGVRSLEIFWLVRRVMATASAP
jgi:NADPH:quinone reductase-like Zn-dependent oxidoreductase